jgi:hypothetical protein
LMKAGRWWSTDRRLHQNAMSAVSSNASEISIPMVHINEKRPESGCE